MSAQPLSSRRYLEDLLAGQMRANSLIIAQRSGLFIHLADQPLSVSELATALGFKNSVGLTKLLANLHGMGLLENSAGRFALSELSRDGLLPSSPGYYGEFIDFFADQFECKPPATLLDHLRQGGQLRPVPTPINWQRYMAAMDRMAILSADRIASAMKLTDDELLLDLGGGTGAYAIAACRMYPNLRATIFDLAETLQFAQQHIDDAGLDRRIRLQAGSVTEFQYGGPYDVVFLSHTIHLFDEPTVTRMFAGCHEALRTEGRLVVRDLFTDQTRTEPALGSLIGLQMWNEGDAYSIPQTSELLVRVGFDAPSHVEFRDPDDPYILGSLLISVKSATNP